MGIRYRWDPVKAGKNISKHGVSFTESASVFADDLSMTMRDPLHSGSEERFVTMGMSEQGRLLVVVHTSEYPEIRIISARKADPRERRRYEEGDFS